LLDETKDEVGLRKKIKESGAHREVAPTPEVTLTFLYWFL